VQIVVNDTYQNAYIHNLPFEITAFVEDYNNTLEHVNDTLNVNSSEKVILRNRARATSARANDAVDARQHLYDLAPNTNILAHRMSIIARPSQYLISPGVRQWEFTSAIAE
jgi:hypothetical protein